MNVRQSLFLMISVAIVGVSITLKAENTGLCTYSSANPNLPRASCYFPTCHSGLDCQPPEIQRNSAIITFEEPTLSMRRPCPDPLISGACWEVKKAFTFQLSAFDPAGVAHIGVHLAQEADARRTFKKYWEKASYYRPVTADRYSFKDVITAYVPLGGRLDVAVYEFCARDGQNNEGCVLPNHMNPFGYYYTPLFDRQ